jgi:hypothetical protein
VLVGVAAAAVSAVAAPRAGAPTRPDPGAFVERLVVQMVRDDYAHAWLALHPAHQAVAGRWEYAFCELRTPIPGHIASLRVVQVADAITSVPGVGRVPAKAVTFRLVLRARGARRRDRDPHVPHRVVGRALALDPDAGQVRALPGGRLPCPAARRLARGSGCRAAATELWPEHEVG